MQETKTQEGMDIQEIMKALPHRYPFLLIDRITKIDGTARTWGVKQLSLNEEFFNGYFPLDPQLPPTLLTEAMAQVGAAVLMSQPENESKYILFGAIDNATFHRNARPGERLDIEAEMLKIRKDAGKTRIFCRVNEEEIARADFMFALTPNVA
jgi:beta-hydroxyacyl-ACP dehydratase FabZ